MFPVRIRTAILLPLMALAITAVVPRAVSAQSAAAVEWAPDLPFDDQFFPAYAIARTNMRFSDAKDGAYRIGVPGGSIGIRVRVGPGIRAARMRVVVELPGLADVTSYDFTLPGKLFVPDQRMVYVFPEVPFHYRELLDINQPFPVVAKFTLYANGRSLGTKLTTLKVRNIQDCPLMTLRRYPFALKDMSWMFAAFVNENHPAIDGLLREALDTGIVHDFSGYQSRSEDDVVRQMMAVWVVLARKGIVYSSITPPSVTAQERALGIQVMSQRVRFFGEALGHRQANCVDGSALLASIFRRIGLGTTLVLRPGHCYLGIKGANPASGYHLETTLMGARPSESELPADRADYYRRLLTPAVYGAYRAEVLSFLAALDAGYANYAADAPKLVKREEGYLQVHVDVARDQWGVMPISR